MKTLYWARNNFTVPIRSANIKVRCIAPVSIYWGRCEAGQEYDATMHVDSGRLYLRIGSWHYREEYFEPASVLRKGEKKSKGGRKPKRNRKSTTSRGGNSGKPRAARKRAA